MSAYTVDRIAILPGVTATRYLTRAVLTGREDPPLGTLLGASKPIEDASARWDAEPIREIIEEAMRRFEPTRRERSDAWLAPRLHATLRLTRNEAAESGLWNFLALVLAPDYVIWRWGARGRAEEEAGEPAAVQSSRFDGAHYVQAFARLWWAAELFRDGEDYLPVETAFVYQDMFGSPLRLDVIDHRPVALAFVRVLEEAIASGAARPGDMINALSRTVNTTASTLMYEVLAPDDLPDHEALETWIEDADSAPAVPWDRLPDGPADGRVSISSIDALVPLFRELLQYAVLRNRSRQDTIEGI